ncbi:MAG: trigger factor [Defluviitaleaceae bacterium]|nr:trigger factor [Defluviitaleaceae bacterium]
MSVIRQVERVEDDATNCKYKLTFCAGAKKFEEACEQSYQKNRGKYYVQGFRQGKAPRKLIEIQYGKGVFYEDAVEAVLPEAYDQAVEESGLDIVLKPSIDISEITPADGAVFVAEVYVKPELTIDGYYALTYKKMDTEPTEEEINERVNRDLEKNARTISVERPAQDGDIVAIDYLGTIDGEPFEGGAAENHDLTIGSKSFIEGFEEQLIGASAGEERDVRVTFPADYHGEEVAGKDAVFHVTVKDVKYKEVPEADDDFAQDVSEFDTFDEYRQDIEKKIEHEKEHHAEHDREDQVMRQLIERLKADIPDAMYDQRIDDYVDNYKNTLYERGYDPEKYMEYFGQTEDTLRERYRELAVTAVKGALALEAVAKAENMETTEEDIAAEAARLAEAYGMNADKFLENMNKDNKAMKSFKQDALNKKAMDFVVDKAVAIE